MREVTWQRCIRCDLGIDFQALAGCEEGEVAVKVVTRLWVIGSLTVAAFLNLIRETDRVGGGSWSY